MRRFLRSGSWLVHPIAPESRVPILAALFWVAVATSGLAAPPYVIKQTPELCYVPKATWFDAMLASRAALQADEAAGQRPAAKVIYHSDVVRGRDKALPVSVAIHGVTEVYLYVTGAPEVEYGAGDWIAPTAVDADGNQTLLCSNKFLHIQQGFHTVDCSLRSRVDPPLIIADESFEHGINNEHKTDYSSVAYWYQREPHEKFPELPPASVRRPASTLMNMIQPLVGAGLIWGLIALFIWLLMRL